MARGINKVFLIGHLGQDPDPRPLPSGGSVVNCSLATTEGWNDASGQKQERTEWHKIVMFNKLADIASQYLRKGSQIYVEGSLRTKSWEKDGIQRYTTEIVVREMQMLGGRPAGFDSHSPPPRSSAPVNTSQQQSSTSSNVDFGDLDDDIPF